MKRFILGALTALILMVSSAGATPYKTGLHPALPGSVVHDLQTPIQKLWEWGDNHVYLVKQYEDYSSTDRTNNEYGSHGSGVWLDNTYMATACHVPADSKFVWAMDGLTETLETDFVVEWCDTEAQHDTAYLRRLRGVQPVIDPVIIGAPPKRGERLYIIGFPHDAPLTITSGWMIGKSRRSLADDEWMMAAQAAGGNSGGAVVVLRNGKVELVGILTAGYGNGDITFMHDMRTFVAWRDGEEIMKEEVKVETP